MTVKISEKGWLIETTHMSNGCLEQGGISGRIELVTNEQLSKLGITGLPTDEYGDYVSNESKVRHEIACGMPTRVIRKGHRIY